MIFNYFSIIIGFICFFFLFHDFPLLEDNNKEKESDDSFINPSISIIIPARNEATNLPNLLNDLKKQNCKINEIICVDDDSTDSTAKIIKESRVKYLNVKTLPKGWKGKTWACQNGAKIATGDLLLFIDADVRFSSSALNILLNHFKENGNPISIQPYHSVKKRHEFFSLFFNLIQICSTYLCVYKHEKYIGFYGPVLLIPRKIFLENGGYESVKNSVIEDINLGKFYNSKDIVIDLILGGKQIKFNMYPSSFNQVVEGWSKNFSRGSVSIKFSLFIKIFFWIVYLTILPLEIIRSVLLGNFLITAIGFIIYGLSVIKINKSAKIIGSYPLFVSIFYPLYLVVFHLIFFYSILGTFIFKTTKWKGRNMKEV